MKSLFFLTAFLGGFGYLTHQFSFWFAIAATYLVGMGLVALIAFLHKTPKKAYSVVAKETQAANS